MTHSISSDRSATLLATPLHGGCHGTRDQTQRPRGRSTRPPALHDRFGRHLPQLPDHPAVQCWRYHRFDRRATRLHDLHRQSDPSPLPPSRDRRAAAHQASGTSQPRYPGVPRHHEAGHRDQPDVSGLRILELVGYPARQPSGEGHRHPLQRRSDASALASSRLFGSSSQAHHEGQTRRGGVREGQEPTASAKKKR